MRYAPASAASAERRHPCRRNIPAGYFPDGNHYENGGQDAGTEREKLRSLAAHQSTMVLPEHRLLVQVREELLAGGLARIRPVPSAIRRPGRMKKSCGVSWDELPELAERAGIRKTGADCGREGTGERV